mgnify:CR=1 FL=1
MVHDLTTLFSAGAVGGLTDGDLLARFASRRDAGAEAAFAELVERHGPMVMGVCRRILNDPHDADDAFQATFLVLVRCASTVRVADSLAPWLYGVSRRIAVRARNAADRRKSRERPGVESAPARAPAPDRSELLAVLDEEIAKLPGRYRAAVVLCDLGGASREEAARRLGCAVGTVGSRLSRGRERLRDRLTRRGLAVSAGPLAAWLPADSASAAVSRILIDSTVRAGSQLWTGQAALIAANIASLMNGVLKGMLWTKLKFAAVLALPAALGLIAVAYGAASEPSPPAIQGAAPAKPKPNPEADPTPAQVLAKTFKTYAEAKSYEDEGEVVQVFIEQILIQPTGKWTVKRPFSTRFVRPKLYRYEFSERKGDGEDERTRYVIWSDAAPGRSKHWWTIQPEIKVDSLETSIGGAAGVSGGSSLTIPALLMPDAIKGNILAMLKDLKPAVEEVVDGVACVKIEGNFAGIYQQTIWIDKKTALVRKLYHTFKIPNATVQQTTTYKPRINVDIAPKEFEFTPPKP